MKKNHFLFETLFFTLAVISLSIQIIMTIFYSKTNIYSLDTLIDNWTSGPITKLYKKDGDKCPDTMNVLSNQRWKGTLAGGRDYFGNIISMSSNASESYGVNSINAINELNTNKWRGYLLCGERLNVDSYFQLKIVKKPIDCGNQMVSCGLIDSMNNHLCLSNKLDCPINYINVANDTWYKDTENYIKYQDVYFFMSNENTLGQLYASFIIKDFVFSEGIPCIDSNYVNMTDEPYILDYQYSKSKCPFPTLNQIFFLFDSYPKGKFYFENGISQKLNELPEYKGIPRNIQMNVYKRSYIGLNIDCVQKLLKSKEVVSDLILIKSDFAKSLKWNTLTIMIDSAAFLLFIVKFSVILTKKLVQNIKKPGYTKPMLMIITVFSCIFSCIIFSNLPSNPLISMLNDSNCVDKNTFSMMNPLMTNISLIKLFAIINIVIKSILTLRYGILTAIKYAN